MRRIDPPWLRSVTARFRSGLAVLGVLLATAGCALPGDSSPPAQTYLLEVEALPSNPAQPVSTKTLLVTPPKAAPGFDSSRIAYTRQPLKLDYYRDSVWSDTPARMLQPVLVRALETTGVFPAVVTPPAPGVVNLRLDVDIIRLQQEFMHQPSQVRLTARVKVIDSQSGRVMATRVFDATAPAPSEDAEGAARGANAAVRTLLTELIPFVSAQR